MLSAWLGIAVMLSAVLGLLYVLNAARARYGLDADLIRKVAHVGFGVVSLAFPMLFHAVWPVALLAAIAVALSVAIRRMPNTPGAAAVWIKRGSAGGICLVGAVALVFALAAGDRVLYAIPVLTTTIAGAAAVFVGTRYGRTELPLDTGKSLEGSLAFFVAAAACAQVPLMLMDAAGALDAARISLGYAGVVTAVEAASGGGSDNLSVPLVGYFAVSALVRHDSPALHGVVLTATLIVGAVAIRRFFAMGFLEPSREQAG